MRGMFGLVGVLLTLVLVGVLVKRQLPTPPPAPMHTPGAPARGADTGLPEAPTGAPRQQVDQIKKDLDRLMQAPPVPQDQ